MHKSTPFILLNDISHGVTLEKKQKQMKPGSKFIPQPSKNHYVKKEVKTFLEAKVAKPLVITADNPFYEYFHSIEYIEYGQMLIEKGLLYSERQNWLYVGEQNYSGSFLFFISLTPNAAKNNLSRIFDYFKENNTSFRIIKNGYLHYRLNGGDLGLEEVGKFITVFSKSIGHCKTLAKDLPEILIGGPGPLVENAFRISKNVYTCFTNEKVIVVDGESKKGIEYTLPPRRLIPFKVQKQCGINANTKFINRNYAAKKLIRENSRGFVFKGIGLCKHTFRDLILKIAKPNSACDIINRYTADRLKFQHEIINKIQGKIKTSRAYDIFEHGEYTILVLEWLEGQNLADYLLELLEGRPWNKLDRETKKKVLQVFIGAANWTKKLHDEGVIHRDITTNNFHVDKTGDISGIDLEMAFDYINTNPKPPFNTGTIGFVAPEQLIYGSPSTAEDRHSLGAMLISTICNNAPHKILQNGASAAENELSRCCDNIPLINLALKCVSKNPNERPVMSEIIEISKKTLATL